METNHPDNSLNEEIKDNQVPNNYYYYCLIGNIPITFHSADLRNYFATFVKEQKFDCFHFRHRPQFISIGNENGNETGLSENNNNFNNVPIIEKKTFCAIVKFNNEYNLNLFIKFYHGKYWMDKLGNDLEGRCVIQKVRLNKNEVIKFSKELRPPKFMPHGNVGTSNEYFLQLIRQCKLPPSLIKKLGLEFPAAR